MTSPWTGRPANWGAPGHVNRGDEAEAILDQLEYVSTAHPVVIKYKSGDTPRTNTTAFASDPHLTATMVAGAVYAVDLYSMFLSPTAADFKVQHTAPSGATFHAWYFTYETSGSSVILGPTGANGSVTGLEGRGVTVNDYVTLEMHGVVITDTVGGTFATQWAQDVASLTASTLAKGSRLHVVRIG